MATVAFDVLVMPAPVLRVTEFVAANVDRVAPVRVVVVPTRLIFAALMVSVPTLPPRMVVVPVPDWTVWVIVPADVVLKAAAKLRSPVVLSVRDPASLTAPPTAIAPAVISRLADPEIPCVEIVEEFAAPVVSVDAPSRTTLPKEIASFDVETVPLR